ncbi:MAG: hypothetical protein HY719_03930 [Planctomycetes bacterium]|nr:hypothetical protein [Planctomycetota bacterium]
MPPRRYRIRFRHRLPIFLPATVVEAAGLGGAAWMAATGAAEDPVLLAAAVGAAVVGALGSLLTWRALFFRDVALDENTIRVAHLLPGAGAEIAWTDAAEVLVDGRPQRPGGYIATSHYLLEIVAGERRAQIHLKQYADARHMLRDIASRLPGRGLEEAGSQAGGR